MVEPITIRPLTNRDTKTVARILGKALGAQGAKGVMTVVGDDAQVDLFKAIGLVFSEQTDELMAWLADLIGKTAEEFDKMPPATTPAVIEAIKGQEDFKDFLAGVSSLLGQKAGKGSPKSKT
jgi:hypothetical protein